MAQFPLNPRIGQAFLPNDENVIYVWNGFSWDEEEVGGAGQVLNVDGGVANSVYGGVPLINGGGADKIIDI